MISPSADGGCPPPPPPPPQAVDSDLLTDICDVNIRRVSARPLPFRMLLMRCMTFPEAVEDCCCNCLDPLAAVSPGIEGRDW